MEPFIWLYMQAMEYILKKKVPTIYVQNEINVLLDNYMLSALLQFNSTWNKFLLDVSGRIFVPYAQNGSFQQVDFRPFLLSIMEIWKLYTFN